MKNLIILFILCSKIFGQIDKSMEFCSKRNSAARWLSSENVMTENQERIDIRYYDIHLKINPNTESIEGFVTTNLVVVDSGLATIDFDLKSGYTIDSVVVNNISPDYTYASNLLSVHLEGASPPLIGQEFTVSIYYQGDPQSFDFGSFSFDTHSGEHMIWTLSEPYGARGWWPCKDDPSDKADSVDLHINVPNNLIVASNGILISEVNEANNRRTYHWHESYPITTYLVSLAIYPYQYWEDTYTRENGESMPLTYYVFPNQYDQSHANYLLTKDMLGLFEEKYGLYPFFEEKYGHADFAWGGGMEHQTLTSMGGWSQWLIAHELAHQWWGDMITCADFHHIWLNEGFARYGEALWEEATGGAEAYHAYWANHAYYGAGTVFVEDASSVSNIFNGNLSYNKAGWVLNMLRHVVEMSMPWNDSSDVFFDMLKAYANTDSLKYASATTEDFQAVCEDYTGLDLNDFFQQWIYGEYYPKYQLIYDDSFIDTLRIQINQTQSWQTFHMPIDIRVTTSDSVYNYFIDHEGSSMDYDYYIPENETIINVELDPDNWILKSLQVLNIQEEIVPGEFSLQVPYPNPFNARLNIPFSLGFNSPVKIEIQNVLGQTVWRKTENYSRGNHILNWQGRDAKGGMLPSGIYFVSIAANQETHVQKILYLK